MKPFVNFRPFLFWAVGLALGILSAKLYILGNTVLAVIISVGLLLVCVTTAFLFGGKEKRIRNVALLVSVIVLFAVGSFSTKSALRNFENANLYSHVYEVSARVDSLTENSGYKTAILSSVKLKGVNGGKTPYKIRAYVYGEKRLSVGDEVYFTSRLTDKPLIYNGNFSANDVAEGIKYLAEVSADKIIIAKNFTTVFEKVNFFIKDSLSKGLSGNEFAMAYALLTGFSGYMDGEVIESYRSAGIAHIFAVSGLHIGILAMALTFVLGKLKVNKYLTAVITTLTCFFYSGVCGFSSSSLRATVMCAVMLFARATGKKYDALSSVSLAGTVILLFSPLQLFCVGFRLSFSVVLGIVLLSSVFTKLFKFMPSKLASALGTVISAQIASIPICLTAFKHFSVVSVIFNLVFLPLITPVFIALLSTCLIGGALGASLYLLFPLKYVLTAMNSVITFFDYSPFMVGGFTFGAFAICYYVAYFISSGIVNLKKIPLRILTAIMILTCLVGTVSVTHYENGRVKAYVTGSDSFCAVLVESKSSSALIVAKATNDFSLSKLKTLATVSDNAEVDEIIVLNGACDDVQVLYTRLRSTVKSTTIRYLFANDKALNSVISASFIGVTAFGCEDNGFSLDGVNYQSSNSGYGLGVTCDGFSAYISGNLKGADTALGSDGLEYNITLAVNYQDYVFQKTMPSVKASFTAFYDAIDCESQGVRKFYFD